MKFGKKLLIIALLAALFTPTATSSAQKSHTEMMLFADENTQSGDYEGGNESIIHPTSTHITITV